VTDASGLQHRQSWELIPWIINGTASESERRVVEEHLQSCVDCRGELQFQQRLQRAVAREGNVAADTHASWARLSERLDAEPDAAAAIRPAPPRPRLSERSWMPWVMAAMLVQGVGLGVLGTALWSRAPSGSINAAAPSTSYRTLAAAPSAVQPATVRVVFAPNMTLGELRAVLTSARLQVVSGPSDADVWSLAPAGDSTRAATESAVRALRSSSSVRFAEPIGAAP
jgi:predicted anti-sigma-YlaC factor YlaD